MTLRITIEDASIRAAVMRRMFPNETATTQRTREIWARYISTDACDSFNMARATRNRQGLGPLTISQRKIIFGSK